MKAKIFLFLLFSCVLFLGCKKETKNEIPTELLHTWKLVGFGNTADNSFKEAEPKNCETCYILTFLKDGKISGQTSTNEFFGEFRIKNEDVVFSNLVFTDINELFDGSTYRKALGNIIKYDITNKELKLYYSDKEYLFFKIK